jgi:hypothetical protein
VFETAVVVAVDAEAADDIGECKVCLLSLSSPLLEIYE